MSEIVKQVFAQPDDAGTFIKRLYPVAYVKKDGEVLYDISGFSISRDRDNLTDSFNLSFVGQSQFVDLDPYAASPKVFSIETGYKNGAIDGEENLNEVISGYIDKRSQRIVWNEVSTECTVLEKTRSLLNPQTAKIFIDVYRENRIKKDNYDKTTEDLEDFAGIIYVSDLINFILSGTGISFMYACYDYKINNYRKEDFPVNIIKDLIEPVGGYIKYNSTNNCLELLEKHAHKNNYDFLYLDTGDIIEIGQENSSMDFINAIVIEGTEPDNNSEYDNKEENDEEKTDIAKDESLKDGSSLGIDDNYYLVDTVQGKENAPSDPYVSEIPKTLIEEKFYNVYLGFEIDINSVKIEGGSWNKTNQKYEGGSFLGYGGFVPAETVLQAKDGKLPMAQSMMPGEGLLGTPWNYEENKDNTNQQDLTLEEGLYQYCTIKGKVVDVITKNPIANALVSLNFTDEDNIWQYFRHRSFNAVVKLYMPSGTVADILGNEWEDVTSSYPSIPPPEGFPKEKYAGTGDTSEEAGGAGIFYFEKVPISDYTATASAMGYDDNDLEIQLDNTSFDFLKGKDKDKNAKYKLLDTPYFMVVWAKRMPPISMGFPTVNPEAEEDEDNYSEESKIEDTFNKTENISIDLRYTAGINKANGKLLYGDTITDARILSEEAAIKFGTAAILNSIEEATLITLQVPHNPWLEKGDVIAVQSYIKGWYDTTIKLFVVDSIDTLYSIGDNEEGLYDTIKVYERL